ncbi:hypothetical protein [Coxiella-like endosymbiont]|uniref:hypothetical protein n=1 Tax=Coxiella-like endosymbiont TaxID=1592897 RepID=UPI00272ABD5E|nr:hypothetical protein [Coxiella-like endosymbiont]
MLKSPSTTYLESPKALADTVVFILLVNKDKEQLLKDYDILIELEKAATFLRTVMIHYVYTF